MTLLRRRADWLLFIGLGVIWGSSYLFIKIGVETITPLTLVALRLAIGALVLGAVFLVAGGRLPRRARTWFHLTVMAVLNIVVPFSLITWAELNVASSRAAVLTATTPLFAVVIAALVLRSERITSQRVIGLLTGFAGVVVLVGPAAFASGSSAVAVAAVLGAAASYAAATVYARRTLTGLPPMVPALLQVAIALVISGSLALLVEGSPTLPVDVSALVSLAWLGVLGSGVAYLIYFRLIRSWGATRTAAVTYLMPVVGIALGAVVANETIDARVLAGSALVVGGVALLNLGASRGWLSRGRRAAGARWPRPQRAGVDL
jgi:drug/metabolite transporter (DMT)-like permease